MNGECANKYSCVPFIEVTMSFPERRRPSGCVCGGSVCRMNSSDAEEPPFSLLTALPIELSLHFMSFLGLPSRLKLRVASKSLRTLASLTEGWAQLAHSMWWAAQRRPPIAMASSEWPGSHASSVVPACVHGATLADCCARVVPWPRAFSHCGLIARNRNLVVAAKLEEVGDPARVTFAAVNYGTLSLSTLGIADTPYPHQHPSGQHRAAAPRNPLPFSTPATALGAPKSWALRLTAYFEAQVITTGPGDHNEGGESGALSVGLVDSRFVEAIERRVAKSSSVAAERQQQPQQPSVGSHSEDALSAPTIGHVDAYELEALFRSASEAPIHPDACCIFLEQTIKDSQMAEETTIPAEALRPSVEVALVVITNRRKERRTICQGHHGTARTSCGARTAPSSTSPSDGAQPFILGPDDTIGCGIDYVKGVAFFVLNGSRLLGADMPIDLSAQWHAAIGSHGSPRSLRANFGADTEAFSFDVLSHEAELWHDLHGRYALKELRKRNVEPSASFCAAFPNLRIGAKGSRSGDAGRNTSPSCAVPFASSSAAATAAASTSTHIGFSAGAVASMAAATAHANSGEGMEDQQPSWSDVVDSYLEPWLVRQLDAAARVAQQQGRLCRSRSKASVRLAEARRPGSSTASADGKKGNEARVRSKASGGSGAGRLEGDASRDWYEWASYECSTQGSSRIALILSALLPPEEVDACSLRLLAHGVTVREVLSRVWPAGDSEAAAAAKPSADGLSSLLRLAGYPLGQRQRLVSRMQAHPPPASPACRTRATQLALPAGVKPSPQKLPVDLVDAADAEDAPTAGASSSSPRTSGEPCYRQPPPSHGFVDFRVTVTDPHRIGPDCFLVVHSRLMDWGQKGWTATLRPTGDAAELRWRPPQPLSARAACGSGGGGSGRGRRGVGPIAEASGVNTRVFVGCWGGHVPEFRRQPVPAGVHKFVLALSGKEDGYGGWLRALHKDAGEPDASVTVRSGETSVVEMRLTIGDPDLGPATSIVER